MDKDNLEEIIQAIKELTADLRAETVVADLVENNIDTDHLQVKYEGAFFRPIRKDILSAEVRSHDGFEKVLELILSRNGIYDALPEGLFHQPAEELPGKKSVKTLADEYKGRKKQEQEARKFFQPIENEFFRQRVNLELKERQLLYKFRHLFNDFLLSFWKIDRHLPRELTIRLIRILPMAHQLAGNMKEVSRALAYTLNEKVSFQIDYKRSKRPDGASKVGVAGLGSSLIAGDATEPHPVVTFTIGPLENSDLAHFLPGGQGLRFINVFYGYFIPFHIDAETKVLCDRSYRPTPESMGVLEYALQL